MNAAPPESEEKLAVLRVMRMLEDKSGRNNEVVKQYMAKRWSEKFHGQRDIQAQLMSHLDYALAHTDWHAERQAGDGDAISRWTPYDKPVVSAQKELSKLPVYQRVYQSLKTRALGVLPADLNLRDQVGPTFDQVFTSADDNKLVVPQFLTRYGLQSYFVKQRDELVELTAMDSWVLNLTRSVKYSDADRAEIQRQLPEFSAIREEINKASHPSQPELNWKLVESLALAIFKANGVDLHTATYYTLARTRTQGLAGFCEGAELLAAMVSHDWDKFWPQGGPARTEMLDWFNSRTGNILRQQISFAESDLPLIYRTERALQLICDKLQQVELKRVPRVENLLYFMQNTRKRLEPQLKSNTENAAQTTVRTLIYAPETQASSTPEAVVPPLPGLPEMKVEVRSLTENPPQASVIKQGSTVRGFIAGIACSVAVASALWWWQVYPVQQQLLQVNDTAQGAATVWMASPELENYERRLQQLLDTSPVQPLETGMQMMRVADSRWPESLQQQQASTQWNEALKTRAQSSPQLRGWLQTRQDLHAFADLVMQREKEGLTLSYIKNVIWQAERGLGQETPVESLLTQYHDARAQKQNTDALEKQINERLEGVLSRWLLLKNNVMPEAATGTTAEK
ncbi:TPA: hypothetical protein J5G85_001349 [Escherichia coli]|nr:hypothetical protein [Escherichia coli]HAO0777914.1 hypothetical protein [Escherichia coli]HAO1063460.1 hypothetical protein [Escherichia coli]HBA3702816.1 hypothetical protein [Escherichia coli]